MNEKIDKKIMKSAGFEEIVLILDRPKRFTDLLNEARSYGVVTSTLDRQINKMLRLKIIKRTIVHSEKRGPVYYALTDKGKRISLGIKLNNEIYGIVQKEKIDNQDKLKIVLSVTVLKPEKIEIIKDIIMNYLGDSKKTSNSIIEKFVEKVLTKEDIDTFGLKLPA